MRYGRFQCTACGDLVDDDYRPGDYRCGACRADCEWREAWDPTPWIQLAMMLAGAAGVALVGYAIMRIDPLP